MLNFNNEIIIDKVKPTMDKDKNIENNIILGETSINTEIEMEIKNIQNKENYCNMEESNSDFIYEYKIVIIGTAGATIELVKKKSIKNTDFYTY